MTSRRNQPHGGGSGAEQVARLEERLGYRFERADLLTLALTHRSFAYESRGVDTTRTDERTAATVAGADNEQLEFLGDAVLGLVVAECLYENFPQCTEGEMTRLRSSLVSRKRMAEVGEQLGLGEFLILGRSAEQVGGRTKPALLANASEAVIAAMYRDGGLEAAKKLIVREVVEPEMAALKAALEGSMGGALRDHKTLLQELVQATGAGRLRYVDSAESGPAHQRMFRVEAQLESAEGLRTLAAAEGATKKEAQQKAAELALKGWERGTENRGTGKQGNRERETGSEGAGLEGAA